VCYGFLLQSLHDQSIDEFIQNLVPLGAERNALGPPFAVKQLGTFPRQPDLVDSLESRGRLHRLPHLIAIVLEGLHVRFLNSQFCRPFHDQMAQAAVTLNQRRAEFPFRIRIFGRTFAAPSWICIPYAGWGCYFEASLCGWIEPASEALSVTAPRGLAPEAGARSLIEADRKDSTSKPPTRPVATR
jgi:hypothetical protein